MDIAKLREVPHLSASSINDYIDCGLLYRFGRIDKIKPEFISDSLLFGAVIHKVLAEFYQGKVIGRKMPLKELLLCFENIKLSLFLLSFPFIFLSLVSIV